MQDQEINDNDIAIIGMAGKFPQADNVEAFWQACLAGKAVATRFTEEQLQERGVAKSLYENPDYVPVANVIEDIESFDWAFFGFTEQEATIMDPQRRLMFESVYHAIEDAGCIGNEQRIGLYIGSSESEYFFYHVTSHPELFQTLGGLVLSTFNDRDFTATQLAYKLDLRGPAVTLNTACSTSLVAIHHAVNAILNYECDVAVAGGASVALSQQSGYLYKDGGINSAQGQCRPFDANADGTLAGSGGAAVVLKRLSQAIDDGDQVYAVIRGTAINNDGSRKVGYTAPSLEGQAEVLKEAMYIADVDASQIAYIETHGTGTSLGDPIEFKALCRAFAEQAHGEFCGLGSLKANFGHMNAAAGVSGVIKIAKMLQSRQLPAQINYDCPNNNLNLTDSPFYISTSNSELPESDSGVCAGVSSFGIGGTNAHAILQEPPVLAEQGTIERNKPIMLLLSATSSSALQQQIDDLEAHFKSDEYSSLGSNEVFQKSQQAAQSLMTGRGTFQHRRAVLAQDFTTLQKQLSEAQDGYQPLPQSIQMAPLIWVFSGQGEKIQQSYCNLFYAERIFRDAVLEAWRAFCEFDQQKYRIMLSQQPEHAFEHVTGDTNWQQPLLFVYGYGLSQLWKTWGIQPGAVTGHSLGEFVAGYVAGLWTLRDVAKLVHFRGTLMQESAPGGMLSVLADEERLGSVIADFDLDVAAFNAPGSVVVSGAIEGINKMQRWCEQNEIHCKALPVKQGFHSRLMCEAAERYAAVVATVEFKPLKLPFLSTCRAEWVTDEQVGDPQYWTEQILQPVKFRQSIQVLTSQQPARLMEVGPSQSLTRLMARQVTESSYVYQPRTDSALDGSEQIWMLLAEYWCRGGSFNTSSWFDGVKLRRVSLPGYPFQRKRAWLDKKILRFNSSESDDVCNTPETEWLYQPEYQAFHSKDLSDKSVLFFSDNSDSSQKLVTALRQLGVNCCEVFADKECKELQSLAEGRVAINPEQPTHFDCLLDAMAIQSSEAINVLYGWQLSVNDPFVDYYLLRRICRHTLAQNNKAILTVLAPGMDFRAKSENYVSDAADFADSAMLSGILKVIPQERDGLRCRYLQRDNNTEQIEVAKSVLMLSAVSDKFIQAKLLNGQLERLVYRQVNIQESQSEQDTKLSTNDNGHYLMVGGLSRVGRFIGDYLASVESINLTILGTRPLHQGDGINPVASAFLDPNLLRTYLDNQLHQNPRELIGDHREFLRLANQLSACYILKYLKESIPEIGVGASLNLENIHQKTSIHPEYHSLITYMLHFLTEQNLMSLSDGSVQCLPGINELPDAPELEQAIAREFPQFNGLIQRLTRCANHFTSVLNGHHVGIEVLYPEGSSDFLNNTALDTSKNSNYLACANVVAKMIDELSINSRKRTVRILEVGGGNGSLVKLLVKQLQNDNVNYLFTDIGFSFVARAKQLAGEHNLKGFSAQVLDMNKDLFEQGLDPDCFDLILGYNVIHVAPNVKDVSERLAKLLKPGGRLAFIEDVQVTPWTEMVWGMTKEWWSFDGSDGRHVSPLMDLDQWQHCLSQLSFTEVLTLPETPELRSATDVGLIVAGKDNTPTTAKQDADNSYLKQLAQKGANVTYQQCDVTQQEQLIDLSEQWQRYAIRFDGVFYAATTGTKSFALIDESDVQHGTSELDVKAKGLNHLAEILNTHEPDFVYVMSSNSSILGGLGHGTYASANSWQDAFCDAMNRSGNTHWLALNWDAWGDVEAGSGKSVEEFSMSFEEALHAFELASRQKSSQVIISRSDLSERTRRWLESPISNSDQTDIKSDNEQAQIIKIWQQTLGTDSSELSDNFFRLGGDSLLAVQLVSRINQLSLGKLKLADFISNATVEGIMERLGIAQNHSGWSPLVTINKSANTPTVFCIHPGGGGVQPYHLLSEKLEQKVNFVGVQSRRFQEQETWFHDSIPDMVAEYRQHIKQRQPKGPYHLMGYCFGCMITHELARQFEAEGDEVAKLLLIDGFPPGIDDGYFDEEVFLTSMFKRFGLENKQEDIASLLQLPMDEVVDRVIELVKPEITGLSDPVSVNNFIKELIYTNKIKNAFKQKSKVNAPVVLIRTQDADFHLTNNQNSDLSWQKLFESQVVVETMGGNHFTVFEPERIEELISAIKVTRGLGFEF